ncbi:hypothetical protein FH063_002995 [Azospirillum argentinense]|uniref:Uncharacterized protein n=1 Tax=Azospirillum argentinense TaxID=2970906 RepID=A0A5B0KMN9_9PROT|nr:hypothetical protein FH063_002995 [Azospirillum argentinense]
MSVRGTAMAHVALDSVAAGHWHIRIVTASVPDCTFPMS